MQAKKRRILNLTPQWIMFEQFWVSLKTRNLWLIHLRYAACLMLVGLLVTDFLVPSLTLPVIPLALLAVSIAGYNILFHYSIRFLPPEYAPFHGLHFALIQITADFVSLAILIYYTGGIESPFYLFFIFHVILGSLILPGRIMVLIITITLSLTFTGAMLELHGAIAHNGVIGFLPFPLYNNGNYLLALFTSFTAMLYVSFYLANSISKELYLRERSLNKAYLQLEEAEAAKSRYVMSVVHDLKTPIAAAITYLNMILEKTFGDVPAALLHPVERSHARLTGSLVMINDVLQFSQLKLTKDLTIESIDVHAMLEEIYAEMKVLFEAKRLRFSQWWSTNTGGLLEAEPKMLKLALSNLLSNAYKYTPEGGRVEVHAKMIDESLQIVVADNGIGIPDSEQQKIFDDFYRSSVTRKKGIEGTGLGMSVILFVVHQFNGTISVESPSHLDPSPERPGTAFTITLPTHYVPALHEIED